jgi:hypothetical protein
LTGIVNPLNIVPSIGSFYGSKSSSFYFSNATNISPLVRRRYLFLLIQDVKFFDHFWSWGDAAER